MLLCDQVSLLMSVPDRWVQIFSTLAVLFGIGLVVLEIRQNQVLVRAQLESDNYATRIEILMMQAGDSPDLVTAKACLEPESMTPSDMITLEKIYLAQLLGVYRQRRVEQTAELGIDWKRRMERTSREVAATYHGRRLLKSYRDRGNSGDFSEVIDQVLNQPNNFDCKQFYEELVKFE